MFDPETEQLITGKYRYYAGLVWDDFYTLLSVLDESMDKTDLDRCWNDFYFSFWRGSAERHSFIDDLVMVYFEKMPLEDRDILEMDPSFQIEVCKEEGENPSIFTAVRDKLKSCFRIIVKEKIEKHFQKITGEVIEELADMDSVVMPSENGPAFSSVWEEFAFQVRKGREHMYHPCEKAVLRFCRIHLGRLSPKEIRLLWLGTPHGKDWRGDGYLPDEDWMLDILERAILRRLEDDVNRKCFE